MKNLQFVKYTKLVDYLKVLLFFFVSVNAFSQQTTKPNIIFIMSDDHAKEAVSCYGSKLLKTPNIDKLAEEGIRFDDAFVTNSICGPSRAVFLTGKFSHKNGFKSNFDEFDGSQATLAKYLQANGYFTSIVGKWHLKSEPQGFDDFDILIGQGEYYKPRFYNGKDTTAIDGYATDIITDKAIELLEKNKESGKPVFMMVHHKAPHRNFMPDVKYLSNGKEEIFELPPTFYDTYQLKSMASQIQDMRIEDMYLGHDLKIYLKGGQSEEINSGGMESAPSYDWYEGAMARMTEFQKTAWDKYYKPITEAYYNQKPIGDELLQWKYQRYINDYVKTVQSVDDNIGRLMKYLKDNGLEDNTLVIYTSDQGFFLGEHGWYDKRFMYEPSLTIPLIFKYPKSIKNGTASELLVQNLDLAPTILDLAGINIPADMQGEALKDILTGKSPGAWRNAIYYHYYQDKGWHKVAKHFGIRTERYKLICFYDLNEWEMYDLKNDPNEMNNLYNVADYETIIDELKIQLRQLIEKYEDDTVVSF